MRYLLLGRLEVASELTVARLGPTRQRALLASLLLQPRHTVSVSWLVDTLWPAQSPRTARTKVHWYVSELRKALAAANGDGGSPREILITHPAGYELHVLPGERDLDDFEQLVADGRRLLVTDPAAAAARFRAALGLWRGAPLEDLQLVPWLEVEVARLDDMRLTVLEDRIDAELAACCPPGHLVAELKSLVADHPLRERFRCHLMSALYLCGRQAEALTLFQDTRRVLIEQLGIEPGPELQRLHREILAGTAVPGFVAASRPLEVPNARPREVSAQVRRPRQRPVPAQLPHLRSDFTGRGAELAQLESWLTAIGAERRATPIFVLDGAPGAGKTTLAVQFAHQVADRFPDGQLYVDLRGFGSGAAPLAPVEVLAYLLRSLGGSLRRSTASIDEQAATYRTLVAGKRVLIVLDNAASGDQVRSALPGAPGSMVLVTSRDRLADVVVAESAHRLTITALSAADAGDLLARLIGRQRVAAEPAAAAAVARLCGYLPLALAIAGERACADLRLSLVDLASELASDDRTDPTCGPPVSG